MTGKTKIPMPVIFLIVLLVPFYTSNAAEPAAKDAVPAAPPPAVKPIILAQVPESPLLTKSQIQTLNRILDSHSASKDYRMFAAYSRLLGLTRGDERVDVRLIGGKDKNNIRHTFGRISNSAGYFLVRELDTGEMHMYWVGADFKLIAAIVKSKDNSLSVLDLRDAEPELKEEWVEWAKTADKFEKDSGK